MTFASLIPGRASDISKAEPGMIFNFKYKQPASGDVKRYMTKVLSLRKLSPEEISRLDSDSEYRRHDSEFKRSETLVTCRTFSGETRSFYAERCEDCTVPYFGTILFHLGIGSS
jgi:hypothetical protein